MKSDNFRPDASRPENHLRSAQQRYFVGSKRVYCDSHQFCLRCVAFSCHVPFRRGQCGWFWKRQQVFLLSKFWLLISNSKTEDSRCFYCLNFDCWFQIARQVMVYGSLLGQDLSGLGWGESEAISQSYSTVNIFLFGVPPQLPAKNRKSWVPVVHTYGDFGTPQIRKCLFPKIQKYMGHSGVAWHE
jgi:hypothetical protein